jgi:TRAP-type uncharacterized transport system substrate-binding protein
LVLVGLGLAGLCAAGLLAWHHRDGPAPHVRLTPGPDGTTRTVVARTLAAELGARGTECTVVPQPDTEAAIESVRRGDVDFALVSAVHRSEQRDSRVRVVTPLHVEALHLLVKRELADRVTEGLGELRGQTVDLGPKDSAGANLAADVLQFAEIDPADGSGIVERHSDAAELEALADRGARSALPAAIFHLATMPSLLAEKLVREAGYVVAPLPFAEAFRLQAVLAGDEPSDRVQDRRLVIDTTIPPFLYQTRPAVPAASLPTLGTQLVLLAHDGVSDATIERMLDTVFDTRFARVFHPALDPSLLAATPRSELHRGTLSYLAHREPAITGEAVNDLSNSLSVLGALIGGAAFLYQGWRQRQRASRDQIVAQHLRRVAEIERRIVEIELGASLDLDTLIEVQRELLRLKSGVLDHLTSGAIDDPAQLSSLVDPIDTARDHVGDLLLHVRSELEDRARREGHAPSAVWNEAAADGQD